MKAFSIIGYHRTGKTTLVVNLLEELKKRGYKVASIKDIHRADFTMEKEDSNSQKHLKASENVVFARGLKETHQIWKRQLSLNEMLSHLDADFVIVEGMKKSPLPKILCAEDEQQLNELCDDTVFAVSGNYAEENSEFKKLPTYPTTTNIEKLVDLIEEKVFPKLPLKENCKACKLSCREMTAQILQGNKTRNDCATEKYFGIRLKVNAQDIELVPFVQKAFKDSILGFVRNLKGADRGKVEIVIEG